MEPEESWNIILLVILLIFFIIPGIIYMVYMYDKKRCPICHTPESMMAAPIFDGSQNYGGTMGYTTPAPLTSGPSYSPQYSPQVQVLIQPPATSQSVTLSSHKDGEISCPSCHKEVSATFNICPNCQYKLH